MISALRAYVLTAMLALAATLAMSLPAAAVPAPGSAVAAGAVAAGSNLLGNPRGTTGDTSAQLVFVPPSHADRR